jgi:cation diffusion facilitator CzcD-associated flavoprotein CzcO
MTAGSANGGGEARHARVAIIGAGFSGIGMAIRLLRDGISDFFVLERAEDLGGTWRDNTYPGCQCDIPSALYSFSFAPNPDWSRLYPLQSEIREYLHRVADEYGVVPSIRFGHELRGANWDEDEKLWRLETSRGELTANVLVGAMGGLTEPQAPDIPGLDRYQGAMFHSAEWDHDHDLAGERVAVIGTGASAVQIVPEIQPDVASLSLFQRTPVWVMPDADRPVTGFEQRMFRRLPVTQRTVRGLIYLLQESTVLGTIVDRRLSTVFEQIARRHLRRQVPDPGLREKLTPSYTLGCKRITMSNTYYRALTQPNADVVTEPITEFTARGIRTADGAERELDAIVLATGFKVFDHPGFAAVRGRGGQTLLDAWQGSPRAYLGTAVAGFPNLFFLVGPNSAGGYNSIIFSSESHVNYVAGCVREMERANVATVEVRPEVYEAFNRETDRRLGASVWNQGGCASWYIDPNGRNGVWWPGFTWRLWQRTRRFDRGNYIAQPA